MGTLGHVVSSRYDDAFNDKPCTPKPFDPANLTPDPNPCYEVDPSEDPFTYYEQKCCDDSQPAWLLRQVEASTLKFLVNHDSYCDPTALVFLHQAADCGDARYMLRNPDRVSLFIGNDFPIASSPPPAMYDGRAIDDEGCEISTEQPGELFTYARYDPKEQLICAAGDPDASLFQSIEYPNLMTQAQCAKQVSDLVKREFPVSGARQFPNPNIPGMMSCCIVLSIESEFPAACSVTNTPCRKNRDCEMPGMPAQKCLFPDFKHVFNNVGPAICKSTPKPDPSFVVNGVPDP